MKCKVIIDKGLNEDEALLCVREKTPLVDSIESYINSLEKEIYGYKDKEAVCLNISDIYCITIEDGRVIAVLENEKYYLKQRLYVIEEQLGPSFLKINQSTILNTAKIKKFSASFGGCLMVTLKNGFKDYVSRRQLKQVKEKIGGKL